MEFTVYALVTETGVYIGATGNPANRYDDHLQRLKYGMHPNYRLQRAFDLDPKGLTIRAVCVVNALYVEDVCDAELRWINAVREDMGREWLLNIVLESDPKSFAVYGLPKRPKKVD